MAVACASGGEVRLDGADHESGNHSYQARKRLVPAPEHVGKTRIGEGNECGREEVDEGCGHEHTGAKVLAKEDDVSLGSGGARGQALREEGEAAC